MKPEWMPSLGRLVDRVFADGAEGAMFRSYPQLFNEQNMDNLLVFTAKGEVVSHLGMTQRWASICGAMVRVACVGAVATDESVRKKGLATRLLDAAREKAYNDGVDFMLISGSLGLYRRAGAAEVGNDARVVADTATLARLTAEEAQVAPYREGDLALCVGAYQREPVRWLRPLDDWRHFLESRSCMNRKADLLTIRWRGVFGGYMVVGQTPEAGTCRILEYAGTPMALAAALEPVRARYGAERIHLHLPGTHIGLCMLLAKAGADVAPSPTVGTLVLIHTAQLVDRLRVLFAERAGQSAAAAFEVSQTADGFAFRMGDHSHRVTRTEAAQLVFGHPGASPPAGPLSECLPVPALWYGLNYV